jgi:hypothetical protein
MIKLLSEEHIPYDVIEPSVLGTERTPKALADYDVLILPDVETMDDRLIGVIDDYVRNGGRILATGATSTRDGSGKKMNTLRLQSLGVLPSYELLERAKSTYLKVYDSDKEELGKTALQDFTLMMVYSEFLKCTPAPSAHGLMKLVPGTMFGPPEKSYYTATEVTDVPGVIVNEYSKGKSVFVPWNLGSEYYAKGNYMHRALFLAALRNVLQMPVTFDTDAPAVIELSHEANRAGAFEWVGMINHSGQIGGSYREPVPVRDVTLRFKSQRTVKDVWLMRSGKKIEFKEVNGWVECVVPRVEDFEMVVCGYW